MNISQMKNIVVLKDIPSNIVDEAIVILKNNTNIRKKEFIENKNTNKFNEQSSNGDNEFIINEAESVIKEYIKSLEKPKETKININKVLIKYRKLQVYSFLLGIIAIIGILVSIIK